MTKDLKLFLEISAIELEKERKKQLFLFQIYRYTVSPLMILTKIALVVICIITAIFPPNIIWAIVVCGCFILLNFIKNPIASYESYLKTEILPKIFKEANPTFNYFPKGINRSSLDKSGIFDKSFFADAISVEGEDHVKGVIENVEVEFTEISFFKEKINYLKTSGGCLVTLLYLPIALLKNSNTNDELPFFGVAKDTINYYKGLYMYADFHKNFEGKILLIPKKLERFKDKFNKTILGTDYIKIEIENSILQQQYHIYSDDEQTAYYTLSPKIIDAFLELCQKEEVKPILSFCDGKMFMTIPWEKDYFSIDIKKKINDISFFTKYIQEIESFQKIILHFRLNQRIWSKA